MQAQVTQNSLPQQPAVAIENDARALWELRANRRIEYVAGTQLSFKGVLARNEQITAAYAEMYLRRPDVFKWAGMAALTSAAVGRGMYMMRLLQRSRVGFLIGLFGREVDTMVQQLGSGNLAVFKDIYWQHMAYDHGGLPELQQIFEAGRLHPRAWEGWQMIDEGRRTGDEALVWAGNRVLLHFEQKEVLQPEVYDAYPELWQEVSGWVTSPILGHYESITTCYRKASLGDFPTRWRWIEERMLPDWQELDATQHERVSRTLENLMIGGAPFALPGVSLAKLLGQGMWGAMRGTAQLNAR